MLTGFSEETNITKKQFKNYLETTALKSNMDPEIKVQVLFSDSQSKQKIEDLSDLLFGESETVSTIAAWQFIQDATATNGYEVPYNPLSDKKFKTRRIILTENLNPYSFMLSQDIMSIVEEEEVFLEYRNFIGKIRYTIKVNPEKCNYTMPKDGFTYTVMVYIPKYHLRSIVWESNKDPYKGKGLYHYLGETKCLVLSKIDDFGKPRSEQDLTYKNLIEMVE